MPRIEVTPEELIAAFRAEWPLQFEITSLRLLSTKQGQQIAQLTELEEPAQN